MSAALHGCEAYHFQARVALRALLECACTQWSSNAFAQSLNHVSLAHAVTALLC